MKPVALTVALLMASWLGRAEACSCSGQGLASALTRSDQTYGVRLSERLLLGQGAFNAHGTYASFAATEHDRSLEYVLSAAYRWRRLELAGTFGTGARLAVISGESARTRGASDTTLRARYEAASDPEPWQHALYPAFAMLGTIRLPTASATGIAPRGLGATELALGFVLERSVVPTLRLALLGEIAGRLVDTTLGVARRLGPRASAELSASYFLDPDWVLSALVSVRWEGNATLRGRTQSGTAQRTTELGGALSFQPWSSPFRAGLSERYAPPLDQWGANTVQSLTSELWIGYVR